MVNSQPQGLDAGSFPATSSYHSAPEGQCSIRDTLVSNCKQASYGDSHQRAGLDAANCLAA